MTLALPSVAVFLCAFLLSCGLTWLLIGWSARLRLIDQPRIDRWHRTPTPNTGGVAVLLSFLLCCWRFASWWQPVLVLGATALSVLGFVDDRQHLRPLTKFAGQSIVAAVSIASGAVLRVTPWEWLNIAISFLWITGLTNAFNLIDNMDGLCGGVAVIAAGSGFILALQRGNPAMSTFMAILAGSICGFLVFNIGPARIFMGDCGSLFIGFSLAVAAIWSPRPETGAPVSALLCPVLAFLYPISDMVFVSILRSRAGKSIFTGGRDHTSHHLVASGLSARWALGLLWIFSAVCSATAFVVRVHATAGFIAALLLFLVTATSGVFLAVRGAEATHDRHGC